MFLVKLQQFQSSSVIYTDPRSYQSQHKTWVVHSFVFLNQILMYALFHLFHSNATTHPYVVSLSSHSHLIASLPWFAVGLRYTRVVSTCLWRAPGYSCYPWSENGEGEICRSRLYDNCRGIHSWQWQRNSGIVITHLHITCMKRLMW